MLKTTSRRLEDFLENKKCLLGKQLTAQQLIKPTYALA